MNMRIRNYIEENGMTFTFVANRSNIDIKKFSRIMNDKQKIDTDEYERICRLGLKVDPSYFFNQKFLDSKNKSA
ncbi:helix-turn-helix domain-containing protein [Paenibacillus chitinolyticus]|uniref:helix-turn-helix domain-containing protein n=1 Tax=Paenibacillus chitinolyticus TaxID=79263 RepID=UPI0035DDA5C3